MSNLPVSAVSILFDHRSSQFSESITGTLIDSDTCEITLNGILTQFKMYTPNDILGMGEVIQFTAIIYLRIIAQFPLKLSIIKK